MSCEFHAETRAGQGRPRAGRDARERLARGAPGLGHQPLRGEPRGRRGPDPALHPRQPPRLLPLRPHRPGLRRQRWRRASLGHATFRTTDVAVHDQPRPDLLGRRHRPVAGHHVRDARATTRSRALRAPRRRCGAVGRGPLVRPGSRRRGPSRRLGRRHARARPPTRPPRSSTSWPGSAAGWPPRTTDDRLRRAFRLANRAFATSPARPPHGLARVPARLPARQPRVHRRRRRATANATSSTRSGSPPAAARPRPTSCTSSPPRSTTACAARREGITSWGRFPLRMLSLQQTQRFADVLAAAELVRRDEQIGGRPFSLGFFVGNNGTPNRIPTAAGPSTGPARSRRRRHAGALPGPAPLPLLHVATRSRCASTRRRWALDHVCTAPGLPVGRAARCRSASSTTRSTARCPTVVLGTLDKAASISMQAAMRGFYGAARGSLLRTRPRVHLRAPEPDHPRLPLPRLHRRRPVRSARTRAVRADRPHAGRAPPAARQPRAPSTAHYEALLDALQTHYGSPPKIIASSATLAGHDEQVAALYRRDGPHLPSSRARASAAPSGRATPTCSPAASPASRRAA